MSVLVTLSDGSSLRGYEATPNRVRVFRGVPYATSTRFKRATRVTPWSGELDCTRDRAIAIQPNLNMQMLFFSAAQKAQFVAKQFLFGFGWNADPRRPAPLAAASAFAAAPQSENCLFLTVHAPPRDDSRGNANAPLPVMLFVHGGAFVQGAGTCDLWAPTSGSRLVANERVIVVFVNYRLGAFGFLPVDGGGETNCGVSDVLEALRWVQREIGAFGGDPANVTVFGESAGRHAHWRAARLAARQGSLSSRHSSVGRRLVRHYARAGRCAQLRVRRCARRRALLNRLARRL
jgi:carboxylesterase type B